MTFRKSKLIDNRLSWHPLRLCVKFGSQGDQIGTENLFQPSKQTGSFDVMLLKRILRAEIGFQRLCVFVCNCSAIVTPKKALFGVISLLEDLVIAYGTNLVVIVPKALRTFHDQCPVHIRVLTMFIGTFRVKDGGRFKATTFCFLTAVFSVVLSLGCLQLHCHSQKPLPPPPPDFQYPMNSPHYYPCSRKYFLHFGSLFPFVLNHLATLCS